MGENNTRTRVAVDEVHWTDGDPRQLGDFLDTLRDLHGVRVISLFTVGMKIYALTEQEIDVEKEKARQRERRDLDDNEPRFDLQLKLRREDGEPVKPNELVDTVKEALLNQEIYARTVDGDDLDDTGYVIADVKVMVRKRRQGDS